MEIRGLFIGLVAWLAFVVLLFTCKQPAEAEVTPPRFSTTWTRVSAGGSIVVIRDEAQPGVCYAVYLHSVGAAPLGVVPCSGAR